MEEEIRIQRKTLLGAAFGALTTEAPLGLDVRGFAAEELLTDETTGKNIIYLPFPWHCLYRVA